MAEAKTKPTSETLDQYLARVADADRRKDCATVATIMEKVTGEKAVIWGTGIVGFGLYRYKYASGQEGDWPVAAFAARKNDLTLYLLPSVLAESPELLKKLGKHKIGTTCLYLKSLSDVDMPTLTKLIKASVDGMEKQRVR
ncbi:MAG: DUF1801 domain-containing protein [Phycisphaerae bacterium]|nr:DUF1801 domain-containing protein [Gemmatimonadaceae bacterium]